MFAKHLIRSSWQASNKSITYLNARLKSISIASTQSRLEYYREQDVTKNEKPFNWDQAIPFQKVPGPKPLKILGNNLRFLPVIGEYGGIPLADLHERLYLEYGNILTLRNLFGREDMLFLYDPNEIEKVYRNEGVWPIRDQMLSFKYYRNVTRKDIFEGVGGLTTLQGEDWFKMRSAVNSILMQPRTVQLYIKSMNKIAVEFVSLMKALAEKNNGVMPENFSNDINKWSLESMCRIAFDKHLGCLKTNLDPDSHEQKMISYMQVVFDSMYKLEVLPSLWKYINTPTWKKLVEAMDFFTFTTLKYIEEAEKQKITEDTNSLSIFQRLIQKDKKIAVAMSIDLIMAGIDTTSKTLSAALYYLCTNKDAQTKLREEALKIMPEKSSELTKDSLAQVPYLKAVIKETTRLAPIAVGNVRSTQKDMVICGYQVPKGTQILMNHMYLSKCDEHFPDAKKFIPERFLRDTTSEVSFKNTHPFVFHPFGFGPRSCIGKRLANVELEVALLNIVRNFEIDWPHEEAIFASRMLYGIESALKFKLKEISC